MPDRANGDDPEGSEDEKLVPPDYVQPDLSGGTMTIDRPPHPTATMEQWLTRAETEGFAVSSFQHPDPDRGMYFFVRDGCVPPHVGTVQTDEVYGIVVEKILRRCPVWRRKYGKEAR
jgi:hypothetical protein